MLKVKRIVLESWAKFKSTVPIPRWPFDVQVLRIVNDDWLIGQQGAESQLDKMRDSCGPDYPYLYATEPKENPNEYRLVAALASAGTEAPLSATFGLYVHRCLSRCLRYGSWFKRNNGVDVWGYFRYFRCLEVETLGAKLWYYWATISLGWFTDLVSQGFTMKDMMDILDSSTSISTRWITTRCVNTLQPVSIIHKRNNYVVNWCVPSGI